MPKLERLLQFHFVALTILGGFLVGNGEGTEGLSLLAFCAAVLSLVFVDVLRVFHLPAMLAYVLMACATVYCVGGFFSGIDHRQLAAVAKLLVLVQATLHLQKKSRRVFEQLGVFSLLELIVAAVLNDALVFGLLLIPFSAIGLSAMVLLQAYISGLEMTDSSEGSAIAVEPNAASEALDGTGAWISRVGLIVLGPAVLGFAAVFFYGLPRSSASGGARINGLGKTVTGYSEQVRLKQMGKLLQNPEMVMRLELQDKQTGDAYELQEPAYLRGQVLDGYRWDRSSDTALWETVRKNEFVSHTGLPFEYSEETLARRREYDRVVAKLRVEPIDGKTVFSIPPYYREGQSKKIRHWARQWLLRRAVTHQEKVQRMEYAFGTHAFKDGVQSRWFRYVDLASERVYPNQMGNRERQFLVDLDRSQFPNLIRKADEVVARAKPRSNNPVETALALESYLSRNPDFEYTLNLDLPRSREVDPIEEFVNQNKAGHCQYFAAALALMLRSQGIPSRLVVGYKSDEYNSFGEYYIVRQMHAHAWVEAYFDRSQLPSGVKLFGQPPGGGVWMRLDPTPSAGRQEQMGSVSQMMDLAQVLWDDYVLDMNNRRQGGTLGELGQGVGEISSYRLLAMRVDLFIGRLREGRLGGGTLAINQVIAWVVVATACVVLIVYFVVRRLKRFGGFRKRNRLTGEDGWIEQASGVDFYDRLCDLLKKVKMTRKRGQTPAEFVGASALVLDDGNGIEPRLARVTRQFYNLRYGGAAQAELQGREDIDKTIVAVAEIVRQRKDASETRNEER